MAETLLSFGVEKLWNLLVRESERLHGVGGQFNELKSDLNMLRCFLEDADAKKHISAMLRNIVAEIKEIVYDAEDIIETFLLKEEVGKRSGIKNIVEMFSTRRGLALDMKAISKRISKVIRDMQSLGIQQVIVNENYMQSVQEKQREMRQTFSSDNEDNLVGLEKNVEQLVGYLVDEGSSQVVSITGMGGIGKTTLARQVFNHETLKGHFPGLAWVCVSQQLTRKYVWQTILRKIGPEYFGETYLALVENKVSEMTEDELQEKLVQVLESQKALIVFDDIWREEDWDIIKPMFPRRKGWKVLLTSRNEGVALRADPKCFTFKPACLSLEECWTMFRRIVFSGENNTEYEVDKEMEEMSKQMIKLCGGLPLAVKVLGGLLATQYTLHEWKIIYENIRSHIVGGTSFNDRSISSVYHILYMSFEELPIYLKQCFLYLAHFPEDYAIDIGKLSYYWAAEGMPKPKYYDGASIREVGDGCIAELVKRNMVISKRDATTSKFEICHLHDMMGEVCLFKAEEENFVQIFNATSLSIADSQCPWKCRRLAVHPYDEVFIPTWEIKNPKLRSLLFVKQLARLDKLAPRLSFTRLVLLRVLDLSNAILEGDKLPSNIGELIHLRYLNLYYVFLTGLPSSIRNLKSLLYLNIDVLVRSPIYMSDFLKELRELRYLALPRKIQDGTKLELGNLINLERLRCFSTKHSSVTDLHRMTKLRDLSVMINGEDCTLETLHSSLRELIHLKNINIM